MLDFGNNVEYKTIKEVADNFTGLTYKPSDVSKNNNGTLVLRSTNIKNNRLCYENNVYVNVKIFQKEQ